MATKAAAIEPIEVSCGLDAAAPRRRRAPRARAECAAPPATQRICIIGDDDGAWGSPDRPAPLYRIENAGVLRRLVDMLGAIVAAHHGARSADPKLAALNQADLEATIADVLPDLIRLEVMESWRWPETGFAVQ